MTQKEDEPQLTRGDLQAAVDKFMSELRTEIGELRTSVKAEIGEVKTHVQSELHSMRQQLVDLAGTVNSLKERWDWEDRWGGNVMENHDDWLPLTVVDPS